ncbi:hypothetical protein J6590_098230 [Homalodisca vitripennis]|nr:hypothetical protein J6590_098230 [Homalodisca vitripennis]
MTITLNSYCTKSHWLKSPVTDESHTQGEANRRDLQSLFDLKQSDNEFSGENSSTQLSLTPQSRIPPFKPNKNMTIIKQNSPSERLETVPSTFSEREPVNSEMGNPNERIEISTEVSRNVEGELWQRRKYSYQDKRTYSAAGFDDGAECLPPKLSHKSKDVRDSMQLRNQIKFEGEQRWQETELNLSTRLDNSSSFSNSGTKKEDSNLDSNTLYNSEVDVWMETESPMPSLSSISTESRKIAQPVNPVKELFKNTNPEPQFIEMGKTSRYLEGTEGCLNQSIEEVSANNRISSDLGSTESSHQHTNNVQSFNQQSNCSNQDKALDLNSIIQQMEKQLKESSSQFKSSSQFNKVEKQFGKEAQTFLSVENRIDRESAGVNRSSREPSRTQNKPHNTENMLENQPPVLSHPFVNTSNFKNTSRQVEQQRNISKNMFTESDSSTMENRIVRESAGVNRQESDKFWNRNVKSFYDQTFMRNSEDHIVQKRREFKQLFDLPESEKGDELKEFEKKSRLDQVEDSFKESHSVKNEKQKLLQLNNEMYSPFEQTNVSAVEGPPYLNSRMRDQSCMSSSRGLGEEPNNYTVYENTGSGAHNMEQQNIEDLPTDSSRHARIPPPPLPPPLLSSLNNDSYLFEECSQERSSRWNEKERSLYQKVQFHNPSHTDILPPPPSPPFKDTDFWKSDRQRGSGYELDERSSYQQQLSFPSPSDRNTNFRSTVLEEEKQVDKEDQQREKGSKFSSLFDFSDTSRADGKQLTPEASGRDRNQPYERGNSSRNYREVKSGASNFSSNREHSQQETHPYWRKDIKVAYDQTKLELNRRGQSNFSERFDVDRSQDTWKSRYQSNHSRSPDRREKKRGHSFSKLNKYAKYPK